MGVEVVQVGRGALVRRPLAAGTFRPVSFRHDRLRWRAHPDAERAIRSLWGWRTSWPTGFQLLEPAARHDVLVGRLPIGGEPRPVILKTSRVRRLHLHLLHLFGPTRAAREWSHHCRALAAGLPVVTPWALGERHRAGAPVASLLLSEYWRHDGTLETLASQPEASPALHLLLEELGAIVHAMHDAGLFHGDLHPGNVLVRRAGPDRLRVIDWKHVNWRSSRAADAAGSLAKIVWQFRRAAVFRRDHPTREEAFFAGYARAGDSPAGLRGEVEAAMRQTAERLAERAVRRCLESNSTWERRREGDLELCFRRDPGLEALGPALREVRALAAAADRVDPGSCVLTHAGGRLRIERSDEARAAWLRANREHALQPGPWVPLAWVSPTGSEGAGWLVWLEPAPPASRAEA